MTITCGVTSAPDRRLADVLRDRKADILAAWRQAAILDRSAACDAVSGREQRVAAWIDDIAALAGDSGGSDAQALPSPAAAPDARVRDLLLLYGIITRVACHEGADVGSRELQQLSAAVESRLDTPASAGFSRGALPARLDMLATIVHDLRTPLAAIVAAASLLTDSPGSQADGRRAETIKRAARHIARLVTDLTGMLQADVGHLAIERSHEDPADVVREVLDALRPVAHAAGAVLHARMDGGLPALLVDRDRLRQVLANLVGNASKVGASHITVGARARRRAVLFSVHDNGPGIPPQDIPRMFDRYWRGDAARYKGSGLGLPISNDIVRAHGGRMWIESAPGRGATFFFTIPTGPHRDGRSGQPPAS